MKGKLLIGFVILTYFIYGVYYFSTQPIAPSEWKCHGKSDRSQICEFTNFCIDRTHGPFIVSSSPSSEIPRVNMINTGEGEDMWFTPRAVSSQHHRGRYINTDTLFVYGLYSPFHFSHYLYNGLIPLYSTIRQFTDDTLTHRSNLWSLRTTTYWNEHTKLDMDVLSSTADHHHDVVLEKQDARTENQVLPPMYVPICFKKAIVGTGNRCSLWYCEEDIAHGDYVAFRDDVFKGPLNQADPCLQSVITYSNADTNTDVPPTVIGILNRSKSRHITNVPELVQTLLQQISNIEIRLISFDEGCNTRSTAHLVENIDVLITPFGNGLGAGLFMRKPNAMMIAIDARWYSESWFYWPMTSVGIRLYSFECDRAGCQEYEPALVSKLSPNISAADALAVMTQQHPSGIDWKIYGLYQKEVSRRIDIDRFIPFLQDKMVAADYANCNQDLCKAPLERHGFGGLKGV